MNGSVMNRSVMNMVCFEWSVLNRSLLNGYLPPPQLSSSARSHPACFARFGLPTRYACSKPFLNEMNQPKRAKFVRICKSGNFKEMERKSVL